MVFKKGIRLEALARGIEREKMENSFHCLAASGRRGELNSTTFIPLDALARRIVESNRVELKGEKDLNK
jgi:hypothetical protein